MAQGYPQYSEQIIAAARAAFLDGDDWAYTAGLLAVLAGAVLVWFAFPRHDSELQLLAKYQREDISSEAEAAP